MSHLCVFYPEVCLTTEEKAWEKPLSQQKKCYYAYMLCDCVLWRSVGALCYVTVCCGEVSERYVLPLTQY